MILLTSRSKIDDIVNTRNYFTHYTDELEKLSAKGGDLLTIIQELRSIITACMLKEIEFSDEEIVQMLSNYKKYHYKVSYFR
jgi:hypothetical protein